MCELGVTSSAEPLALCTMTLFWNVISLQNFRGLSTRKVFILSALHGCDYLLDVCACVSVSASYFIFHSLTSF